MVQLNTNTTYSRMTSPCVLHARKQLRMHVKRIRQREYCKLRNMVPALAHKKKVDKVTVIEEAVRYIDELHRALAERLQNRPDLTNVEITQDNVKYFVQALMTQQNTHKVMTSQIATSHPTHVSLTSQQQRNSLAQSNINWRIANDNSCLANSRRDS